ncbi:MAG: YggT family protein [Deltaproteobacteria bacterium]|nr:YggT family protein [Deltaproteobacteria bacterium]
MVLVVISILKFLQVVIFVDVIASWLSPDPTTFPRRFTRMIVEPLYAPIYAILGRSQLGGLDFSPMIMLFLLNYIVGTLNGLG